MKFFSFFLPHFLGAPRSEWLLLPKQAAALLEGTQWCRGGTGKAEDAKLQDAGISPKQCPRKRVAEKGWLTGLDKQSTREGRTADNVRRKNRGGAPRGGARRKSCAGASQAGPGMVSRQSTAYPDEEQRDSTCVTTVPPKWPMTAWDTACGDYFRVTTRKLARPLNTSAFVGTNPTLDR